MNSMGQGPVGRRVYGVKVWLKALYLLLAALMAGMGVVFVRMGSTGPDSVFGGFLGVVFLGIGGYMAALALRSRLTIEGTRIEVRGPIREKSAEQSEIEGFRTISSRYGSFKQLRLKDGRGTINIQQIFSSDDEQQAWFKQAGDLDERDRVQLLDEIANQQELGSTPEERLGALKAAKTWTIVAVVVAVAAAAGLNFESGAVEQLCAVVLAAAPFVAAYQLRRSPLLYAIFRRKKDPRPELMFLLLVAGFGLLIRMREIDFITVQPLLMVMAVAAGAVIYGFFSAVRAGVVRGAWIGLLVLAGLYGYGAVAVGDTVFDGKPGVGYSSLVEGKRVVSGRSDTYYLQVAPWGPVEADSEVSVPADLYGAVQPGELVCMTLHPGRLGAQWYRVGKCGETATLPPL